MYEAVNRRALPPDGASIADDQAEKKSPTLYSEARLADTRGMTNHQPTRIAPRTQSAKDAAVRIDRLLSRYENYDEEAWDTTLADLLCDLLHWAGQYGVPFGTALDSAFRHYNAEQNSPDVFAAPLPDADENVFVPLWIAEHGEEYEVPARIVDALDDVSWHNDACPAFRPTAADGEDMLRLYVEHPIPERRESCEDALDARFFVYRFPEQADPAVCLYAGNDVGEALDAILSAHEADLAAGKGPKA